MEKDKARKKYYLIMHHLACKQGLLSFPLSEQVKISLIRFEENCTGRKVPKQTQFLFPHLRDLCLKTDRKQEALGS